MLNADSRATEQMQARYEAACQRQPELYYAGNRQTYKDAEAEALLFSTCTTPLDQKHNFSCVLETKMTSVANQSSLVT